MLLGTGLPICIGGASNAMPMSGDASLAKWRIAFVWNAMCALKVSHLIAKNVSQPSVCLTDKLRLCYQVDPNNSELRRQQGTTAN